MAETKIEWADFTAAVVAENCCDLRAEVERLRKDAVAHEKTACEYFSKLDAALGENERLREVVDAVKDLRAWDVELDRFCIGHIAVKVDRVAVERLDAALATLEVKDE